MLNIFSLSYEQVSHFASHFVLNSTFHFFSAYRHSPRSHSMGSGFGASNAGSSYGPGSGYGPGYGSIHTGNRFQNQSYFPVRPRGSAVSVSSRGTMGSFSSSADRGGNNGGYRGGGGGGSGGRGPLRGRPWPRW
jgi:hypothetical protein